MLISMLFARKFSDGRQALQELRTAYCARYQVDGAYFRRAFERYLDRLAQFEERLGVAPDERITAALA